MQVSYIIVLSALVAVCWAQADRPQVTDTALEDALNDKRFIQRQIKCALGEGPCDPIGKRLKNNIIENTPTASPVSNYGTTDSNIVRALAPLVLRGACPQCTPQETKQIQRTLAHVQRNYPQQWAKIVRQYSG